MYVSQSYQQLREQSLLVTGVTHSSVTSPVCISFLKAHALTEDRNNDSKDRFYDQLQQVFDQFPNYSTESSVRRF